MFNHPADCPKWVTDNATPDWQDRAAAFEAHLCDTRALPTHRTIREWHGVLFADLVPLPEYAGRYRGFRSRCLEHCLNGVPNGRGGFNPGAPPNQVQVRMQSLSFDIDQRLARVGRLLDSDPDPDHVLPAVALAVGELVGEFIRIHPFMNGNGRMSRLLWRVLLERMNLPTSMGIGPRPVDLRYGVAMEKAMRGDFSDVVELVKESVDAALGAALQGV